MNRVRKYAYMLKPLPIMEMPNLASSLNKMGTDTSDYIFHLTNANDEDNLQARYQKYLENEFLKQEEEKKLRSKSNLPSYTSHNASNNNNSKKINTKLILLSKDKTNNNNIIELKKIRDIKNKINESKEEEKENILVEKGISENSRNKRKNDFFNTQIKRKSQDIYSKIKEENKDMKNLFLKTVRYKNNISDLCDKINSTCSNFNVAINERPKFRFVTEKEIQDSITKKDLDVNSSKKPKVNAFKNMQLFREFNALTALSYNLAFDGNKVIKDYLNTRKKKDNSYFNYAFNSIDYDQINKTRKELFKTTREIVRISKFEKEQCIKNIDRYNREVENERLLK